jgi:hypothetical protein
MISGSGGSSKQIGLAQTSSSYGLNNWLEFQARCGEKLIVVTSRPALE